MDPTQAMTQISQRMWHDQGPSSLSISLRRQISTSERAKQLRSPPNCISRIDWPTRESRRQLWRSRWPFCHTCGNAAPPSCKVTKRRNIRACFIVTTYLVLKIVSVYGRGPHFYFVCHHIKRSDLWDMDVMLFKKCIVFIFCLFLRNYASKQ